MYLASSASTILAPIPPVIENHIKKEFICKFL